MTAASDPIFGFAGEITGPGEYAFARRLRHKLILSYLSQERLHPTFQSMVQQTDAHMCGDHLRRLVVRGQWVGALEYLHRFNSRRTIASNALHFFLHTLWALSNVAAGARNGSVKSGAHSHGMALSTVICRSAKLRSVVRGVLASPEQRVALESRCARIMAGMITQSLAREDPDLNRLMQLPGDGQMLPIINPPRRRQVKRPARRRTPGPAIARLYLNKRRSLLHSSRPNTPAFIDESLDRVADLIYQCIKAGKSKPPQSVRQVPVFLMPLETAPAAPNLQTTSVPNEGARVSSQTISGALTNQV